MDDELFLGDDGFSKRDGLSGDENMSGLFAGFDDDPFDDSEPGSEEGLEDLPSSGEQSSY